MKSLVLAWMLQQFLIHIGAVCINSTSLIDSYLNGISTDLTLNKFKNTNISTNMPLGNGENYDNFITMHPSDSSNYGYTIWPLNNEYSSFTAIIGLSLSNTNCINKYGSDSTHDGVIFKFYIDDILKYTSPQIQYASDFDNINISTSGINLKIEIYKLNSAICDIAVIANPILKCASFSGMQVDSTVFVTGTTQFNKSTSSKPNSEMLILILTWSLVFLAICLCVILVYRARRKKNLKKAYNETIQNSSPMAIRAKDDENEMQPLGAANKSDNIQYVHVAVSSETVVVHQQMDTMADMDEIIQNKTQNNEKLVLQNEDTGTSEIVDLNQTENTHETRVTKHSVMETITNLDVGSLPNFDDELDLDSEENDDDTGTNSEIVDMQHSAQNTTVINHSSMNTLVDNEDGK